MQVIALFIVAIILSSCASTELNSITATSQTITFLGARDETYPEQPGMPQVSITRPLSDNKKQVFQFPLSYKVECNTAKSICKHGVVKTSLEYTASLDSSTSIHFTGKLHSVVGRSLSVAAPPAEFSSFRYTMAVPDNVTSMDEYSKELLVEKTILLGEKLKIDGLGGVQIVIEFHH